MQALSTQNKPNQASNNNDEYFPPFEDDTLLESICEAAKKVNPYALFEIATDPYPPKVVQEVVEAVCMLLGLQSDWNAIKNLIAEEKLAPMIEQFHPESVPDIYLEQLSAICNLDEMQIECLAKQNPGVEQLGEWLHAIAIYYDVKHKPMIYQFITEQDQPEPVIEVEKPKEVEKKEEPKKEKVPPPRIISIKEALEAIKNLNIKNIIEVRGYKTPPPGVLLVLEALCILFDAMKIERKGPNQIVYEPNYKKLLQDTDGFIKRVLNLDYDKISVEKIKRLRNYIVKPEFEIEKVKKASKAAASFSLLIISVVQRYDQQKSA